MELEQEAYSARQYHVIKNRELVTKRASEEEIIKQNIQRVKERD